MKNDERVSLLYKVASLYYKDGLKKHRIAGDIKQSPTQVGLLLKEAIDEGIVTIKVSMPRFEVLAENLIEKFNLVEAIVIPADRDMPVLLRNLGQATADYFEKNVFPSARVAVGGGYLIYRMIEALSDKVRDIDIYPTAVIGRGPAITHIDPLVLVTLLWAKSGRQRGRAHYLTITPPDKGLGDREFIKFYAEYEKNRNLKELIKDIRQADFVFTSIGSFKADSAYSAATQKQTENLLNELEFTKDNLINRGAIGDIAYSFFDALGKTRPEWNIFPGIGIERLHQMAKSREKRVVVTVGNYRLDSLKAILRAGLCNVLITDDEAAAALLDDAESGSSEIPDNTI